MIVDKDAGKLYDIRTGKYVEGKIGAKKKSGPVKPEVPSKTDKKNNQPAAAGWGDWWAARDKNNGEFLKAVEKGDLKKVKKILDNE